MNWMTISSHKCMSLLKLQWIICEEHSNYIRNYIMLAYLLNFALVYKILAAITIKQSIFQPQYHGADLDERNSTQSTCDTQTHPVLPEECGQHRQSAAALTGASVHQESCTATQNNDKAHVRNNLSSRTTLHIHDSLNTWS